MTRWLPSRATQERRRAGLPEPAALPALFAQAAQGTPLAPQARRWPPRSPARSSARAPRHR
ncbi:MAG: hypothetical protein U1F67_25090 [Rubrivivax sp.]